MNRAALALALCVVLTGGAGWGLLRVEWAPDRPTVACADVFAGTLDLEVPADARAEFRLSGTLHGDRPAVVVQHQIIDANGFGWVNRSLSADGAGEYRTTLPRVPRTHTVRVGLLTPEEHERARRVQEAARAFDLRAYREARGWVAPALRLCQRFAVEQP